MGSTKEFTWEDDDGEEVTAVFPIKKEVCWDCEGHGSVMNASMREHAYSQEEFDESFQDDEDREAYFGRGGKYDVQCPTCKGANVVDVIDEDNMPKELKDLYAAYEEQQERREQYEQEYEAERRFERMMGC